MKNKITYTRAQTTRVCALTILFAIVLLCNFLTGYCVDDYTYLYSIATKERITSFFQLFPSIAAHAKIMNGRTVAHFLTQLFLWLPIPIFKILNTVVFFLELLLITSIGGRDRKQEILLIPFSFFSLWLFELAFGQVNFWLDGACNYLWSSVAALAFLYPYASRFLSGRVITAMPLRILFIPFGLLVGNFMENSSAAAIFVAVCLVLLLKFYQKQKIRFEEISAIIAALVGYLCMILAPAEIQNKLGDLTFGDLRVRFIGALQMLSAFPLLIFFLAILFVLAYHVKADKKRIILAALLTLGALCSHFLLIFASYFPDRCAAFTVVMLTAAASTLLHELLKSDFRIVLHCALAIIFLLGTYHLLIGVNDVYVTYVQTEENIDAIERYKEKGITDVGLPIVKPATKYSALHGLRYLSEESEDWPNLDMATYYGLTSLVGYDP